MSTEDDFDILWASRVGDIESFRQALSERPDMIHSRDENGNNALHMASANGHLEILLYTLSLEGSSSLVNLQNLQGNTPLHWAALNKKHDIISTLIDYGSSITIENAFNETPIDVSVKQEDTTALSLFEKAANAKSSNDTQA